MQLDVRLPIGLLFSLLGALLAGFGLVANKDSLARSLGSRRARSRSAGDRERRAVAENARRSRRVRDVRS